MRKLNENEYVLVFDACTETDKLFYYFHAFFFGILDFYGFFFGFLVLIFLVSFLVSFLVFLVEVFLACLEKF